MKNIYVTLMLLLLGIVAWGQDEELIPGAVVGSCVEPDSNLITIFFDYSKNCPEADPTGQLAGADVLGFHSGINNWSTIVPFDDPNTMPFTNIGNGIFSIKINTLDYYGTALADIESVHFIMRSADSSDPWDFSCRDDVGGGGFGGDEPCNDFVLNIINMPICSEVEAESSVSLLGPTTAANSCIDTTDNTVRIDFDLGLNCPEADPGNLLAGVAELGFHSGANDWSSVVAWDDAGAMRAVNNGNDIFSVKVDPMAYYGVAMADLENIIMVMNNGIANPSDPWTNSGKDDRDGGFGGVEPCSDLVFALSEAQVCPVVIELNSSDAVIGVFGDVSTCVDKARGKVRISFDLSKNCPEADPNNALAGVAALGFHSGANNFAHTVSWDADGAVQATNNGSDIFTVVIDVEDYYGIPFDSLRNIEFLLNNGIETPDDPWTITGKDFRDGGGFGGNEPCSNLILDISEAAECDLPDQLTSNELVSGLANSCVDAQNGKIRLEWDRTQNCPDADPENMLGETIGFHSGVNSWSTVVEWNADGAMQPTNDGNGLYSMIIDVEDYYGMAMGDVTELNFLFNNGVAMPDDPWTITGKATTGMGGFGGDELCDNFRFVLAEAETCDLAEQLSSQELFSGLANSCVDAENGMIRIDFDRSLNCVDADPNDMLGETIGFHSGVNSWSTAVSWDADGAMQASNDGNGLYRLVLDVEDYYGMPLDSISEVNFLYNNGVASPEDPWTITGKATTGMGGFGGDELCDNFRFVLSEAETCDLAEKLSSQELFSGLANSCVDAENGKVRIDFDRSLNCVDADPNDMLGETIGFHSGVNSWSTVVAWDAAGAMQPMNDGNGLYSMVIDMQAYYGMPIDSISEVNFLFNNGFATPEDPWTITGKATTGMGGFGGDELCDNFRFVLAEAPTCELSERLSTQELFSGLANSCVDAENGKVRIDFDRSLNCVDADPTDMLGETIGFHSGVNSWSTVVEWNADGAMQASNDGNGLYSLVLDVESYYGMPLDSISEVNFLYNNGVATPEDPWTITGKATTGTGGFGGDELCDNFRFVLTEAPACDLTVRASSPALVGGLAASCVDVTTGKVRLDFDLNLNCSEADPGNLLSGLSQIGFHSGVNSWSTVVEWNAEGAVPAVNDGNDKFTVIIDPMDYYGMAMDEIEEINFLFNNGFTEGADPWANTGKDETGMGGFGGDELCDNLLFIVSTAQTCDLSTSTVDIALKNSLKVIPNPFSDQVTIQFDNPRNEAYELNIMDLSGRVVRHVTGLNSNQVTLERGNLVAGMYFVQLVDAAGNFATTKLMVK